MTDEIYSKSLKLRRSTRRSSLAKAKQGDRRLRKRERVLERGRPKRLDGRFLRSSGFISSAAGGAVLSLEVAKTGRFFARPSEFSSQNFVARMHANESDPAVVSVRSATVSFVHLATDQALDTATEENQAVEGIESAEPQGGEETDISSETSEVPVDSQIKNQFGLLPDNLPQGILIPAPTIRSAVRSTILGGVTFLSVLSSPKKKLLQTMTDQERKQFTIKVIHAPTARRIERIKAHEERERLRLEALEKRRKQEEEAREAAKLERRRAREKRQRVLEERIQAQKAREEQRQRVREERAQALALKKEQEAQRAQQAQREREEWEAQVAQEQAEALEDGDQQDQGTQAVSGEAGAHGEAAAQQAHGAQGAQAQASDPLVALGFTDAGFTDAGFTDAPSISPTLLETTQPVPRTTLSQAQAQTAQPTQAYATPRTTLGQVQPTHTSASAQLVPEPEVPPSGHLRLSSESAPQNRNLAEFSPSSALAKLVRDTSTSATPSIAPHAVGGHTSGTPPVAKLTDIANRRPLTSELSRYTSASRGSLSNYLTATTNQSDNSTSTQTSTPNNGGTEKVADAPNDSSSANIRALAQSTFSALAAQLDNDVNRIVTEIGDNADSARRNNELAFDTRKIKEFPKY
jgi:hypothetical protein